MHRKRKTCINTLILSLLRHLEIHTSSLWPLPLRERLKVAAVSCQACSIFLFLKCVHILGGRLCIHQSVHEIARCQEKGSSQEGRGRMGPGGGDLYVCDALFFYLNWGRAQQGSLHSSVFHVCLK